MMHSTIKRLYRSVRSPDLSGLTPAARTESIARIQTEAQAKGDMTLARIIQINERVARKHGCSPEPFSPQERAIVVRYLEALPEPMRTYYARFRQEGTPVKQIADEMGVEVEVVRNAIAKVYADLAAHLMQR